jgi:hypothetical protein
MLKSLISLARQLNGFPILVKSKNQIKNQGNLFKNKTLQGLNKNLASNILIPTRQLEEYCLKMILIE